mmetsp:Transcript_90624/g.230604  ORF Transcript_90624/g.230604 Transcript_90624/m.230604 type:complete len:80 (+) Transcript_90624:361-600(+)
MEPPAQHIPSFSSQQMEPPEQQLVPQHMASDPQHNLPSLQPFPRHPGGFLGSLLGWLGQGGEPPSAAQSAPNFGLAPSL